MSLFIGNLSPRIHRDELEHVFRRFGRCSVQLKDGYGFAVYEFPPNAEKALTALRGKNICGEPIILSWSNKQPRPFRRFARGDGFYEPPYGRKTTRGSYFERRLVSNGRRDFKMGIRHPYTDDRRRINSTDIVDEEMNHNQSKLNDYIEDGHSDVAIEGGSDAPIQVDNDRWAQEVGEPSYDNEAANGMEFDRYDPYHSHEKRDEDASDLNVYSPTLGNSPEKTGKDKARMLNLNGQDNPRRQQTCYNCGEAGHKMRNCHREDASWRRRFSKFDYRQEDEHNYKERGHFEPDGPWSVPGDRRPSCGDSVLMRRPNNYKEASDSGKRRRLMRSGHSLGTSEALKKYKPKKRSRGEDGTLRRPHPRKARSASSPLHSDYPASSRSQSSKSLSRSSSHLRPRSVSSRSRSLSANSRSSSIFLPSKNSKSRSKSSSMPLSLSVSLSQPLPSSPNKAQINPKGSLIKAMTPESREVLAEKEKSVEANTGSQNTKLGSAMLMVKTGNGMSSDEAVDDFNEISVHQRDADDNHAASKAMLNGGGTDPSLCIFEKGAFVSSSSPTQSVSGKDELGEPKEWASATKLHSEVPLNLCPYNSIKISREEMDMVMKHYGMEQSGKNDLFIEDYFGSARLWPWEIVYYRRLRKGPISVENYAQRIVQNQEFGIVDKYVRSSSGWGELGPDVY